MGKRVSDTAPPRLLGSELIVLNPGERGLVGVLTLDTDDGTIELAINRGLAEELHESLTAFLDL